jgi:hypothetical protein
MLKHPVVAELERRAREYDARAKVAKIGAKGGRNWKYHRVAKSPGVLEMQFYQMHKGQLYACAIGVSLEEIHQSPLGPRQTVARHWRMLRRAVRQQIKNPGA